MAWPIIHGCTVYNSNTWVDWHVEAHFSCQHRAEIEGRLIRADASTFNGGVAYGDRLMSPASTTAKRHAFEPLHHYQSSGSGLASVCTSISLILE